MDGQAHASPLAALKQMLSRIRDELVPSDSEAPLALAKARLCEANMRAGLALIPVAGLIVAGLHTLWHPVWAVGIWYAGLLTICIAYGRMPERLHEVAADGHAARNALRAFGIKTLIFTLVWASQAWLFVKPGEPLSEMTTTLVILASSTGAVMSAAWLPSSLIQSSIYVATAMVIFGMRGDVPGAALCVAGIIFGGFILGTVFSLHETTSRLMRLEREKDQLIASLRASDRSKSDFLANMSHELRTPLNAILGFSELMKGQFLGPIGNPRYVSYADDIHASGGHLLSLINDILDLAKIEAGSLTMAEEPVDLRQVTKDALRFFKLRSAEAGIALESHIVSDLTVRGDTRAIKQAIVNLVSNALKFTPNGGRVWIGGRREASGQTVLWVADTGCGIAPADQATVFETFGQGRHDIAVKEKGTGLGLAIVKGIVEAHDGSIQLDSAVGQGTKVTIFFPPSRLLAEETQAA